jgi:CRISPR-associated protein Csx10
MRHFALDLQAVSPLAIRADHAHDGAETTRYISGTTLAGGLAAAYRQFYPDNTGEFEALFLSGQVQYPALYPATFKNDVMQKLSQSPVYPLPKTAQTCKRFSGFSHVYKGEDVEVGSRHGIRDSLLDWAMFRLQEGTGITDPDALLAPFRSYKECPVQDCQSLLDHTSGYYRRDEQSGNMMLAHVDTRLQTHTGINRQTGTVQESILYNRRVFDEYSRFWGAVKVADELVPLFESFIEDAGHSSLVRIGTGRTRGMGEVCFSCIPMEDEQQRFAAFQKRLKVFDTTLHNVAQAKLPSSIVERERDSFYFALTLYSPVILRDHLLRYRGIIDEHVLANLLGLPVDHDHFTLIHSVASTMRITGWNDLWGTPKANEIAIETGSVFLFKTSLPQHDLERALFKLEEEGIGQHKTEGFGRVCVSDPFHREVTLR